MSTTVHEPSSHQALGPFDVDQVLKLMDTPIFWEHFLHSFLSIVHPAEFALTDEDGNGSQRETALSAAFQRVFLTSGHLLGLGGWYCALEAPYKKNSCLAYCDLTLFPWDGHAANPWSIKNQPKKHVRIEVKWRDNNHWAASGLTSKDIINAACENDSDQHFALILVFHGKGDLPIHQKDAWDSQHQGWSKLALFKEPRRYAQFSAEYNHFTLVVMKKQLNPNEIS